MTGAEIIAKLDELEISGNELHEYAGNNYLGIPCDQKIVDKIESNFGVITPEFLPEVDSDTDEDGAMMVLYFKDHNVLIGVDQTWDDFREEFNGYEDHFVEVVFERKINVYKRK